MFANIRYYRANQGMTNTGRKGYDYYLNYLKTSAIVNESFLKD